MSFRDFLQEEINVGVDPTADPATALAAVKRDLRMANTNPQRYSRQQMKDAQDERQDAQRDAQDDPNAQLKMQIAKTKERLARLNQQLASQMKQAGGQQQGGQM